jgi:DNA ligase-1
VAAESSRLAKIGLFAEFLKRLSPEEIEPAFAYVSGTIVQGRVGLGYATAREARPAASASHASLTVLDVHGALDRLAAISGKGAEERRRADLRNLLERATPGEQDFLVRLVLGELRQGAQEGLLREALARAAGVSPAAVRRACMLAGEAPTVARAVLTQGAEGLAAFRLRVLSPLQPMLAQGADSAAESLARLGQAAFEQKLDGARVQVHRQGDLVRVFTRSLKDVTAAVPEVVEAVRGYRAGSLILDGEAMVIQPNGRPAPFQVSMRRVGRRTNVEALRDELPISFFFFDCLHVDGQDLIDLPGRERHAALAEVTPAPTLVRRVVTASVEEAEAFLRDTVAAGHEGVVAKSLDAPYEAGRRGDGWLKVKPHHTLDLIVLAAEWGSGRRRGWLSNLHLGARDPAVPGATVMLGKTFKGMTDEMLVWQTKRLQELAIAEDGYVVHVRPELVVEVSFDGVQASPHYPGGVALRFARVKRYRPDKRAEQADTIDTVQEIARKGGSIEA